MAMTTRKLQSTCTRLLIAGCLLALLLTGSANRIERARAQASRPVLISQETSTRAVAFESVTQIREPFPLTSTVQFSADNRTRIMLYAQNLTLQPGETAVMVRYLGQATVARVAVPYARLTHYPDLLLHNGDGWRFGVFASLVDL